LTGSFASVSVNVSFFSPKIANGYALVVYHDNGWATYYSNLEHMFVPTTNRDRPRPVTHLRSGDVLGYIGSMSPGGFKCLHFELWRRDEHGHYDDIDPRRFMSDWLVLPWRQPELTPAEPAVTDVAA
jgi:murein DD-endopeptidase MepM/ murein hydrolase activator NlpD